MSGPHPHPCPQDQNGKYGETGEVDSESRGDTLVSTVAPFVELDWKFEYLSVKVIMPLPNFGIGFRWFFGGEK